MLKRALFFIAVTLRVAAFAQQTQLWIDREATFKNGLELFDEKNYLSAREKFEEIYKAPKTTTTHDNVVLMQNLEYYIAVCATEANDKDAEQLLLGYFKRHHETDKRRLISFYLGKYYYRNSRYNEAIEYFTKVKVEDLNNEQIYDYKFQLAYSYFTKKKFTEAKPLFASIKDIQDKYYYPATYYYAFICFYTKDYNEALTSFTKIEDSKMYATVIPYYIAQIYYIKKDFDQVITYINKNIDKPGLQYKDEMKFLLGKTYFQKSDYKKAYPLLNEYVTKTPKVSKEDIYQLAYSAYMTGEYEKAIDNFKQLTVLDEKLGQNATYAMADCYLKLGQKDKARSAFQSAAGKDFDDAIKQNALFNYGKLSFELGYSSEAIQSFDTYLDKYSAGEHAEETTELLATALVQTKNYERAYKIMEGLKSESALIKEAYQKVTYFRAVELYNDNKADEALLLCEKSLKNPLNLELQGLAIYLKAEILYGKERYDEAAQNFQRFAQFATPVLEKKGEASKFRAEYNVGYCSFKKKDYNNASIYFAQAIDEAKTTADQKGKTSLLPDLYLRYADCSFVTKNYSKALEAYTKIADMKWSSAEYALFQKGVVYGLIGKDEEKLAALHELLVKYPGSNYANQADFELGETYLQLGNNEQARIAYQNIISKNANTAYLPKAYVKIGVIDYNTGKKQQAIEDYKLVVKKFPDAPEAKESMDALKDIYVELGRVDEYFAFAKGSGLQNISTGEEDSLTYQAADNAYNANDTVKAATLFGNYVNKFPNGIFAAEAHWKKADCHIRMKEFAKALPDYEALIQNRYSKYYERALLKASGIAYYELKDYLKAGQFYAQLYMASTSAQNTYTAMVGSFRSAVMQGNNDAIIESADQFINSGIAKDADLQEAIYHKGKAYYAKGDKEFALGAFNRVTEMPVSAKAVEAKYMVAKILFEQQKYKNSIDTCFKLKNKYSSYEYWIAKTFILIADNYYAQGNAFQAKATLESIVENYDGDKAVQEEAKTKLENIKNEELQKSKLMLIQPADTLIMEQDSILKN